MRSFLKAIIDYDEGPRLLIHFEIEPEAFLYLNGIRNGFTSSSGVRIFASRNSGVDAPQSRLGIIMVGPQQCSLWVSRKNIDRFLLAIHDFNFTFNHRDRIPFSIEEEYFSRREGPNRIPKDPLLELA